MPAARAQWLPAKSRSFSTPFVVARSWRKGSRRELRFSSNTHASDVRLAHLGPHHRRLMLDWASLNDGLLESLAQAGRCMDLWQVAEEQYLANVSNHLLAELGRPEKRRAGRSRTVTKRGRGRRRRGHARPAAASQKNASNNVSARHPRTTCQSSNQTTRKRTASCDANMGSAVPPGETTPCHGSKASGRLEANGRRSHKLL